MKISLDWLRQYVEIDRTGEEVAGILSDLGFPTEGIEHPEGDTVIDIEVTSNRGDCLGHIGVARELAAAMGKELNLPEVSFATSDKTVGDFVEVAISDEEHCGRYTARVICGVKIGPSPDWMKRRLEAVGQRSVNNVVDATNYAMLESGQPPHAFDCDKLAGNKITVRRAIAGERLVSIDGTKCELNEEMLVIADEQGAVAIAGVMGGLESEISDSTVNIVLEDAHFDAVSVRTTGRRLGIGSESSFRFERQVDIEAVDWASRRAVQLIIEVAGGTAAQGVADVYPGKRQSEPVKMRFSRLNDLLGIEIPKDEVMGTFAALGLAPEMDGDDAVVCKSPSWRHDIYREVDLIEEAARTHGYDNIPVEKKLNIEVAPVDKREKAVVGLRRFLGGCGFYETINVTFVDDTVGDLFAGGEGEGRLAVKDAARKSANLLRQNLIGSLLGVLRSNYNVGNTPCRIYELANTFSAAGGEADGPLPVEGTKLGLVFDGDFRELRGVIEGLISMIKADAVVEFKPAELSWAKAAAEISVGGQVVGSAGVVSAEVSQKLSLPDVGICAGELDFERLLGLVGASVTVKPISRFPAITRDLSLIVDESVTWADIVAAINAKAPGELEGVGFTGIFRGKPVQAGKKSVTFSLKFRDDDGTLRHEIVDGFEGEILGELKGRTGGELRTA